MVSTHNKILSFALTLLCVIYDGSAWTQTISAPFLDMMRNTQESCEAERRRLEPLAEKGDAKAQVSLGFVFTYSLGRTCQADYKRAVHWFQLAAEQGSQPARYQLDQMYGRYLFGDGDGLPQDEKGLLEWLKDGASQGDSIAQSVLGRRYLSGDSVPKDYSEAAKWLKLAAAKEQKDAQLWLGKMYERGWGVPQDFQEAIHLYNMAAGRGSIEAEFTLGLAYSIGQIVPKSDKKSTDWFKLASAGGNERAQYLLGQRFMFGLGVPTDYVQAHMWLNLSAAQGYADAAEMRDTISKKMTSQQMAEAQKSARECLTRKYKDC